LHEPAASERNCVRRDLRELLRRLYDRWLRDDDHDDEPAPVGMLGRQRAVDMWRNLRSRVRMPHFPRVR